MVLGVRFQRKNRLLGEAFITGSYSFRCRQRISSM